MLSLTPTDISQLLISLGYPIMLLLMILEGPIATMTAAFLASLDYFNVFAVFFLSVLGDVIGDLILYTIGFKKGIAIVNKLKKWLKISDGTVNRLTAFFKRNDSRIIFYVKITTGLSWITFTLAGAFKMKLTKFLFYSFLGGLIWSFLLVGLGYFFGSAAQEISHYISYAGYVIFFAALLILFGINFVRKKQTKKIIRDK